MTKKFYSFLTLAEQKDFSLNFLLADNMTKESSNIALYGIEKNAESILHGSRNFACNTFYKHISRYINVDEENIIKESL